MAITMGLVGNPAMVGVTAAWGDMDMAVPIWENPKVGKI
jgi:hypothetical protein